MSRPLNPSWTVPVFAPSLNYPVSADPFSATPTKTTHPGAATVGLTPKTAVAAQVFNKLVYDAYTVDASAKALLDQLVTYVGQDVALNWQTKIAVGAAGNYVAAWSDATATWLVCGQTEDVKRSNDGGKTWSSSLVAAAGANENCQTIDLDNTGNAVIGTPTAFVFTLTAADVAAKVSVFAGNTSEIQIGYDPVSALFAAVLADGLSAACKTSPTGATWTSRTMPTGWADFSVSPTMTALRVAVNRTAGRMVVVGQGATGIGPSGVGLCRAMTSDNGGVTWTDRGTFATTITSPSIGELTYDPTSAQFVYTIGKNAGAASGEIWTSPDGATWTKRKTLASSAVGKVACHGALWISGAAFDTSLLRTLVYSTDFGVTWERAGIVLDSSVFRGVFTGGGGLIALTASFAYFSSRHGRPSLGTLA